MPKAHLLIIDPQSDFCDPVTGTLYVKGAEDDMARLADFIDRKGDSLQQVTVTLDSHRILDISHPLWWRDSAGNHPTPFTCITPDNVKNGVWTTSRPGARARSLAYLEALATNGRYPHVIWPEHCLIGTAGHAILPVLLKSIQTWERKHIKTYEPVTKGSNPWTEHFSAVQAEVPDPEDNTSQVNTRLLDAIQKADRVIVAGEARSHCVANTVRDIVAKVPPEFVAKMVLLTDAMSDVTGFENLGASFIADFTAKGGKLSTTKDLLA